MDVSSIVERIYFVASNIPSYLIYIYNYLLDTQFFHPLSDFDEWIRLNKVCLMVGVVLVRWLGLRWVRVWCMRVVRVVGVKVSCIVGVKWNKCIRKMMYLRVLWGILCISCLEKVCCRRGMIESSVGLESSWFVVSAKGCWG